MLLWELNKWFIRKPQWIIVQYSLTSIPLSSTFVFLTSFRSSFIYYHLGEMLCFSVSVSLSHAHMCLHTQRHSLSPFSASFFFTALIFIHMLYIYNCWLLFSNWNVNSLKTGSLFCLQLSPRPRVVHIVDNRDMLNEWMSHVCKHLI